MCGIFGTTKRYSLMVLKSKLEEIKFRGPDYSEMTTCDEITLGHNRLSIIDLDSRSNQPLHYQHLAVVFNGEIYNYREIREDLIQEGYSFMTASDTEVICAAYLEYGEECVNYFNGMFAFVIFDAKKNKLFGARDRLGQKPFYYFERNGHFEFASQLGQLKIGNTLEVDPNAQKLYLRYKYVPEPYTIYKGVSKLPAGFKFEYCLEDRQLTKSKYWDLDVDTTLTKKSYNECRSELAELLSSSIKMRLFADVPLGIFLSGGIDSALVTSIAADHTSRLRTFSIKFDQPEYDESAYAEAVAKYLGTEHVTVDCGMKEGIEMIKQFSDYFDEPFADASALPTMLLSKYTKEYVTVGLSGDAGDELFAGYNRYDIARKYEWLYRLPRTLRHRLADTLDLGSHKKLKVVADILRLKDIQSFYVKSLSGYDETWLQGMSSYEFGHLDTLYTRSSLLEGLSAFDIKTYLCDDINVKTDRASMAFSLEARAPMMDYRLVEFSQTLPLKFKYHRGIKKRILKDILFDRMPQHMFNRPKKGFSVPLDSWFRNDLKEKVLDTLTISKIREIEGVNPAVVMKMLDEHMKGERNRYAVIWKLLVLLDWRENAR